MKHLLRTIYISSLLAGLWGCTEEVEPKPATYSQLLTGKTSKTWQLSSVIIIENGEEGSPIPATAFGCTGDDSYIFYAGAEKQFQITEGSRKCNPNDPDLYVEDNWSLVNATATLIFVMPLLTYEPLPFIVKSLTNNQLTVEIYLDDEDDTSYRFMFTSTGG